MGAESCRGFTAFLGSLRRGAGAVSVPSSLHEPSSFASASSDAGRAVNNERGFGNPSLCREKMPQALRGGFLFYSLAFLSELPGRKSKNKKLGQIA